MATRPSVEPGDDRADKARGRSRASLSRVDANILEMTAMFCGAALVGALLLATYGVDLIAGFF